jgi:hypothetical protein
MARARILSILIRAWKLLLENIKPHLAEMPQVQPLHTELQGILDQASALDNEQEETRSKLRDIVRRRQELERTGEIVRRRMEAHLRGTYGYTNEQLIKFGIKPRPRVIRRKAAKPPEGETPPAPAAGTPEKPPQSG